MFLRFIIISLALINFSAKSFSQENQYEIYAIEFASLNNKIPVSTTAVGSNSKDSTGVNYMIWLLKGKDGKNILVDAGFSDSLWIQNMSFVRPDKMLERLNISPNDITDIILTHPHWDHIGGINLFPRAMIWMQKTDYEYFVSDAWQSDGIANGFNTNDVKKIVQRNLDKQLNLVKGDNLEILPGLKVFTGSKHTFGSQYVLVNVGGEEVIIASDNSWFYYNLINLLPIPVTHDMNAYLDNLKRMKIMIADTDLIIPGHDPLVMKKFPKVAEGIVKIEKR